MRANIVFTLTGKDRIGIVEEVTHLLLDLGGNVESSRMARLGGEFAILMLVSLPSEHSAGLDKAIADLTAKGYKVTVSPTEPAVAQAQPGWTPYKIQVQGADHEGIIHEVARYLSQRGINIESLDAGTTWAPVSGTPLFTMDAVVAVPPSLTGGNWQADLVEVGHRLNVEIQVSAAPRT